MFTLIKKNWLISTLVALAAIYVIVSLIRKEWNPMKWFSLAPSSARSLNAKISKEELIQKAIKKYANNKSLNVIKQQLSTMTKQQLENVISERVTWCGCTNSAGETWEYGFTTNCSLACA